MSMRSRDLFELILLASLWGASFLFMRISTPEFGAVPLMFLRVLLAGLVLLPLLIWRRQLATVRRHWRAIFFVGIFNSAIPFCLIAYSTLYVTAGFASILNASTPMFAALVGYLWLSQRISVSAVAGLVIGLAGVVLLVWDKLSFDLNSAGPAILAGLSASLFYAIAAIYSKRHLAGVNSLAIAGGSQIAAALFLLPGAIYWWPQQMPSQSAWLSVALLAVFCTGFAYILYFRLIEHAGPANATTVTFLVPAFGMLWGYLFLGETVTIDTLIACSVILLGTALTIGVIRLPGRRRSSTRG